MIRRVRSSSLLAASAMAILPAAPSWSQAPAPEPAAQGAPVQGGELGDIVVTGEKRATKLQSAPIAITAIGGDLMRERNINELDDLGAYVPGLTIARVQGSARAISIRGIGYETASNINSQPGVAFHIDGVYIANVMATAQDLIDVDRIEVLRGPQGTVFGETSTGGAINVITKKPVIGKWSGEGAVSYGNYNYVKTTGALNIPISDVLAARVAVDYLRHDGYGYSIGVAGKSKYALDDANDLGARASLLFQPTDTFSALLEGQLFHANHHGSLQKNVDDTTPGTRVVDQDLPSFYKIDTRMIYLTLKKELGDTVVAKSVSAYQYLNKNQSIDSDRTANPALEDHVVRYWDHDKTFTQELQLSSQNTHRLEWDAGAFYMHENANEYIYEITTPANEVVVAPDGTPVKFVSGTPYQHRTWALYGQTTWHATDALAVTAGLRYNWDKISAQPTNFYQAAIPRSTHSDAFTGKIGVEYKLTRDNLLYVTGSKGYKPRGLSFVSLSGFTPGSFASGPQYVPPSFKQETVYALEVGSKNDFLDHKIRLNVDGYYYWYKNFQYTAEDPVPFAGGTDNIPRARVYGLEFEGSVLPFQGLRFDGSLSLAKGKFTSNTLVLDAQTAAQIRSTMFAALGYPASYYYDATIEAAVAAARQNVDGKSLPKMPGVTGNVSGSYTADLGRAELTFRAEIVYRGKFNYAIFGIPQYDRVPSYTIGNLYLEYAPDGKPWKFSLSANNVTNEAGINSRFADPYGSGTTSVEYIAPRQVFGTVSVKF